MDLLIYRVEVLTGYAHQFGGTIDADYNAGITAFKKAMKIVKENLLQNYFEERCKKIFKMDNLDYWYIYELIDLYNDVFENKVKS